MVHRPSPHRVRVLSPIPPVTGRHARRAVLLSAAAAALGMPAVVAAQSAGNRLLGLDVSAWQGNISQTTWNNIRNVENRQFVFVRASRGAVLDIIVDLRPESPTYLQHISVELSADNHRGIYIPERFAHGYQALEDNTETTYHVGEFYTPGAEGGLLYDDPALGLTWPLPVATMSDKDREWKPLSEIEAELKARMSVTAGSRT